jgi:uncharacterized protein (DUF885 family)
VTWPREWLALDDMPSDRQPAFFERWSAAPAVLDREIIELRKGLKDGSAAPQAAVQRLLQEVVALEGELNSGRFASGSWQKDVRRRAMIDALRPAIGRYREFISAEYLPHASASAGLAGTAGGEECFLSAVGWWTGLAVDMPTIEQTGMRILASTNSELERTAGVRTEQRRALLDRLRTPPPRGTVPEQAIIEISRAAIDRAREHLAEFFTGIEDVPIEVRPLSASAAWE